VLPLPSLLNLSLLGLILELLVSNELLLGCRVLLEEILLEKLGITITLLLGGNRRGFDDGFQVVFVQ
jgi:hypothetical protein